MANQKADEIILQRHRRNFIQFGSARPNAGTAYAGQNAQYMSIQGVTLNDTGSVDPVRVPDPKVQGAYRLVNRSLGAADLDQATLLIHENHGAIPRQLLRQVCTFNLYELTGVCRDLSDFNGGWSDYAFVYSGALTSSKDLGDRSGWDSDDPSEISLSLTLNDAYPVGALNFGTKAAVQVTAEVKAIAFATKAQCGDCGVPNDGTRIIYAVQDGVSSPAAKPTVIYSIDYGATWTAQAISSAANGETVISMGQSGNYLFVVSPTGGTSGSAIHYSAINTVTGVPGTSWTKYDVGAIAATANALNSVYVKSSSEIYLSGNGGYIYKSTDITSNLSVIDAGSTTVQNLLRIKGLDNLIVAVGAAGAVVKSLNNGISFAVTTTNPGAGINNALSVLDNYRYWVGNALGVLYYTLDGGETWTTKTYTGQTSTAIQDILFPTDEVGYVLFAIAGPTAFLSATMNGGYSWVDSANSPPRLANYPSFQKGDRIAAPTSSDSGVNVNTVVIGGLGTGTDGNIVLGAAAFL